MERLQKVLARAGIASRRRSEVLIASGRVQVNGATVSELGGKVDPVRDEIRVDGRPLLPAEPLAYLMVHKPTGYVSTASDPEGRPTVLDLVPGGGRLYPAGRLDADSEGLLLLTNDGNVTLRLTHPRFGQRKDYLALVRGIPTPADLRRLLNGVELEGGSAKAVRVTALQEPPERFPVAESGTAWIAVVVAEGRKRLVRRMFDVIGHPVVRLVRVQLGPLKLGELTSGQWRRLTPSEVLALRRIGLSASAPAPTATRSGGAVPARERGVSRRAGRSGAVSASRPSRPQRRRGVARRSSREEPQAGMPEPSSRSKR